MDYEGYLVVEFWSNGCIKFRLEVYRPPHLGVTFVSGSQVAVSLNGHGGGGDWGACNWYSSKELDFQRAEVMCVRLRVSW
jgi:hypothetical protein